MDLLLGGFQLSAMEHWESLPKNCLSRLEVKATGIGDLMTHANANLLQIIFA